LIEKELHGGRFSLSKREKPNRHIAEEEILKQLQYIQEIKEFHHQRAMQTKRELRYNLSTFGCQMNEHDQKNFRV
jgi:hypothetical protein